MINSPEVYLVIKDHNPMLSTKTHFFLAKKSFGQIQLKYKINHIKRFTK
jgi:hypothetical protein